MENCLFCKVIQKEIPAAIVYETDEVIAFKDIHPIAPVHVLVIPKKHIEELYRAEDDSLYLSLMHAIKHLINVNNLAHRGYKIEVNGGGAQIINHLHFHLIGPVSAPKT